MKWNYLEIGIGCGQNFILIKNIMVIFIQYSQSVEISYLHFLRQFFTSLFLIKKRKIYFQRLSGIVNSVMGKKSWYRPKIIIN